MLGLRTISGVSKSLVRELEIEPSRIAKAIAQGYLDLVDDRLVVSIEGRLVVDRLVLDFLS